MELQLTCPCLSDSNERLHFYQLSWIAPQACVCMKHARVQNFTPMISAGYLGGRLAIIALLPNVPLKLSVGEVTSPHVCWARFTVKGLWVL